MKYDQFRILEHVAQTGQLLVQFGDKKESAAWLNAMNELWRLWDRKRKIVRVMTVEINNTMTGLDVSLLDQHNQPIKMTICYDSVGRPTYKAWDV